MKQKQIGTTDLFVSPVAFGAWPIAGMTSLDVNEQDSLATIKAAIDSGINFIDTAYCYGPDGESERLIGQVIGARRDDLVIASKGGVHWGPQGEKILDGRPQRLVQECEESLRRLGIDTIDLYYLHRPDPKIPVNQSAEAFLELQRAGKIRAVGASNFTLDEVKQFHAVCPISAVQLPYNLLQRDIESSFGPWCLENNVSVINYWPLMKGLLAGKIRRGHTFDPADSRLSYEIFQGAAFETAQKVLDGLDEIAATIGKTVAQIVINWTARRPGITSVLCGAKRDWQIRETAGAMGWELDDASLERIDALLNEHQI